MAVLPLLVVKSSMLISPLNTSSITLIYASPRAAVNTPAVPPEITPPATEPAPGMNLSKVGTIAFPSSVMPPEPIEIKSYHLPNEFEGNIVAMLKDYNGLFAIQSYNPLALNYVKDLAPEFVIGLLLDDVPGLPHFKPARILKDNIFGKMCHPAFITYNQELIDDHELDVFRSDDNLVFGFLYDEASVEKQDYFSKVDGIVFGKKREE